MNGGGPEYGPPSFFGAGSGFGAGRGGDRGAGFHYLDLEGLLDPVQQASVRPDPQAQVVDIYTAVGGSPRFGRGVRRPLLSQGQRDCPERNLDLRALGEGAREIVGQVLEDRFHVAHREGGAYAHVVEHFVDRHGALLDMAGHDRSVFPERILHDSQIVRHMSLTWRGMEPELPVRPG